MGQRKRGRDEGETKEIRAERDRKWEGRERLDGTGEGGEGDRGERERKEKRGRKGSRRGRQSEGRGVDRKVNLAGGAGWW